MLPISPVPTILRTSYEPFPSTGFERGEEALAGERIREGEGVKRYFIGGTGTDVGKTYVACALIRALRAEGMRVEAVKPVSSGFREEEWRESDAARLAEALGNAPSLDAVKRISPIRLRAAQSPDIAAKREGRTLSLPEILAASAAPEEADVLLIEGIGGIAVPLNGQATGLEWIKASDCPLILVAGCYLGGLSHALTALRAAEGAGIRVERIVVSRRPGTGEDIDAEEFMASLESHAGGAPLTFVGEGETSER
jgi:dethiobiotin synthetase